MSYTPKEWQCGDTISAEALNHLEQGVANASGGGSNIIIQSALTKSYECSGQTHEGTISTAELALMGVQSEYVIIFDDDIYNNPTNYVWYRSKYYTIDIDGAITLCAESAPVQAAFSHDTEGWYLAQATTAHIMIALGYNGATYEIAVFPTSAVEYFEYNCAE